MKMRPLIFGDAHQQRVREIMAYSERHHFRVGMPPPGDNPEHVLDFDFGYRAVFSYSMNKSPPVLVRHLSVSVPGNLPNPVAVFMIAEMFGFTGWNIMMGDEPSPDWYIGINDDGDGPYVVVGQIIPQGSA